MIVIALPCARLLPFALWPASVEAEHQDLCLSGSSIVRPRQKIEKRRRQFRCRSDTPHGRWHELAVHSAISTRGVVIAMSESKNIDAVPCTSRFRDWRGFLFFLCVCMQASEPVRLIWNAGKRKKEFLPTFAGIRTISCEIPVDLFAFSMAPDGS